MSAASPSVAMRASSPPATSMTGLSPLGGSVPPFGFSADSGSTRGLRSSFSPALETMPGISLIRRERRSSSILASPATALRRKFTAAPGPMPLLTSFIASATSLSWSVKSWA